MLSSSNLVAFIATANPEKSEQFYESVLGLKKIDVSPYALVPDGSRVAWFKDPDGNTLSLTQIK